MTQAAARTLVDALVADINAVIASGKSEQAMYVEFERIFARYADVPTIARYALGVEARRASPAQLREFTTVFQRYISVKYGRRFREFIGGQIEVQDARAVNNFYEVKSLARLRGQAPFEVTFLVSDRSGKDLFFNLFIEGINMVLKIWESEPPYNLEGKFWKVSTEKTMIPDIGQGIILKPFQKPHPPIVGTVVAPYSKGVIAMAERGWLPISANFLMPEWVKTHWPNYVEGKKNIGQVADPADWRIAKSIFVADDEATAQRYGKSAEGPYHFYFKQLVRKLVGFGNRGNLFKVDQSMPDSAITPEYVTNQLVIAGTVNSVADQILAFREKVGDFGTLVYACHDWMDPKLGKRSMELLAEKVMPVVNAAIAKGSSKAA
jgi:ABC-type transporter MlaC component